MTTRQDKIAATLVQAAERLRVARAPGEIVKALHRLSTQVGQPCVIAVVGRVKAGKSSFVNALLGGDLAKVGVTETTATINYFTYGAPDPTRPIRCHWQNGQVTQEDRAFLDGLQGNDEATLRRASGIVHFEYSLLNDYLKQATIVDTPGLEAAVDEHQDVVASFMGLEAQLRSRNVSETERLSSEADAVIFVMGQVAKDTDQAFLDEFGAAKASTSSANAVGIIARIDSQTEILQRRTELAGRIAKQLSRNLNTVLPVSAGIERALQTLTADEGVGLGRISAALKQIPVNRLQMMLDSDVFFTDSYYPDCPVSADDRTAVLGELDWTVFTTIARSLIETQFNTSKAVAALTEVAGFEPLKSVLENRFFARSHILRSFRIVADARKLLDDLRYTALPRMQREDASNDRRLGRYMDFVTGANGDAAVRKELLEFLTVQRNVAGRSERVAALLRGLDRDFAEIFHDLEEGNREFDASLEIDKSPDLFSEHERDELLALFGRYGLETELRLPESQRTVDYVEARARAWTTVQHSTTNTVRRKIADNAASSYQRLLGELLKAAT